MRSFFSPKTRSSSAVAFSYLPSSYSSFSSSYSFLFFSSAAFGCAALSYIEAEEKPKKEEEVMEAYTSTLWPLINSEKLLLIGTAVRTKYMFSVYSYAVYVDPKIQLGDNADDICSRIVSAKVKKSLEMCFKRDITGEDMKDGLQGSLAPLMKKSDKNDAVMKEFSSQFQGLKLKKDTKLSFFFDYNNRGEATLSCVFEGKPLKSIASDDLCEAFLNIYFGKNPISSEFQPYVKANLKNFEQKRRQYF